MNRPIDWKKISELKRQAPPPEDPFGDMLSELLESDMAMPALNAAQAEVAAVGPSMEIPAIAQPVIAFDAAELMVESPLPIGPCEAELASAALVETLHIEPVLDQPPAVAETEIRICANWQFTRFAVEVSEARPERYLRQRGLSTPGGLCR